jgi:hypothetical protein
MDISIYRREEGGATISDFASVERSLYDGGVLELEVYAAGVRNPNKIIELAC